MPALATVLALALSASTAPDTGTLALDGGSLFYETAGAGPAVVLIHGGFGDRRMWDAQFRALASRYRVIRYDHRGFGRSPAPTAAYSPVADLGRLLDHLGVRRAHVVGNSLGGSLALDFALLRPERVARVVVVASGPSGYPATEADRARFAREIASVGAVFAAADTIGPARAAERWLEHPMIAVASRARSTRALVGAMVRENAGIFRLRHWPFESIEPSTYARLAEIRAPTLVILGARDTRLVRATAEATLAVPGSRLVVVPGADHLPQMTHPRRVTALLVEFLGAEGG